MQPGHAIANVCAPIERLKRIAASGSNPCPDDVRWIVEVIRRYVGGAPAGVTLDQAAGVAARPGQERWWNVEARQRRDEALRQLAARFYEGGAIAEQVEAIARAMWRYETSAWRFDQFLSEMPAGYGGTARECLWQAFRAKPGSLRPRQLRAILSAIK